MQYRKDVAKLIWLSLVLGSPLFPIPAHAAPSMTTASFDCTQAKSKIEHAICADSDLAKSDREIAAAYHADLAQVSEEGKNSLRDGQRQWLKMVSVVCTPKSPAEIGGCLKGFYSDREKRLSDAVRKIGGFTFRRVDVYSATKNTDPHDDFGEGFATVDLSYPVIDAPKNRKERGFNQYMQKNSDNSERAEDGASDQYLNFDTIKATPRLISVEMNGGFYGHGAAHGQYAISFANWLPREGRLLIADDIFVRNQSWENTLLDHCYAGVKKYGVVSKDDLKSMIYASERWAFGPNGLTINFNPYEVASYADGGPTVVVPWADLRPYIVPNSPVLDFANLKD